MAHKQGTPSHVIYYHRELEAAAKFSHRKYEACFVKSFGWYETAEAIYITMEYLQHGDLHKYLSHTRSQLAVKEARELTYQILEGLCNMHTNGFTHRDLKPGNILIKSQPPEHWWIKLADFGISKRAEERHGPSTLKGTPEFMAPELLGFGDTSQSSTPTDFQAADMWALGEIAFRMLTGERTFKDSSAFALYCLGLAKYPSEKLISCSGESAVQFVANLMAKQPHLRMKAPDALNHPWMIFPGMEMERDLAASPMSNNFPVQGDQVSSLEGYSSDLLEEPSARWSEISKTGYVEPEISSVYESSRAASVFYEEETLRPVVITSSPIRNSIPRKSIPPKRNQHEEFKNHKNRASDHHASTQGKPVVQPEISLLGSPGIPPNHEPLAGVALDSTKLKRSWVISRTLKDKDNLPERLYRYMRMVWNTAVAFSPDSKTLASASSDGSIRLWDIQSRVVIKTLKHPSGSVSAVAFSLDGKTLASAGYDKAIQLSDVQSGVALQTFECRANVQAVAFLPDNKTLVSATCRGTIEHSDSRSRVVVQSLPALVHGAFSPNGKTLASTSSDDVKLFDIQSGNILQRLTADECWRVALAPDSELLASSSWFGKTVKLWDIQSGALLQTLGHDGPVYALAFSPDGKILASASSSSITLWT